MSDWNGQTRPSLEALLRDCAQDAAELIASARAMLKGQIAPDVGHLLRGYLEGKASSIDVEQYRVRQLTDELGRTAGTLLPGETFFTPNWSIKPEFIDAYCEDLKSAIFETRSNSLAEKTILLEACTNESVDVSLPSEIAFSMRNARRPSFRAYATDNAAAYVHPFRYQLITRDGIALWQSASPRSLLRSTVERAEPTAIDGNVILIQDRFHFRNLSHFIFDAATRILHYIDNFGAGKSDVFVLGSIPSEYHNLVLTHISDRFDIPRRNFFFPDRAQLLTASGKCVWFSDQVEILGHPAQMAHPRSISMLGELGQAVPGSNSQLRRVYISRSDAAHRRVTNEGELIRALEQRGFASVELSKLSAMDQIGLFRGAEVVVAPHGMGLTHMIMGERISRIIELFPARGGTSAYGFVARAAGIQYGFLIGDTVKGTPGDFSTNVGRVLELLGPEGLAPTRPAWKKTANLIPGSRNFADFSPSFDKVGTAIGNLNCGSPIWGMESRIHVRSTDDWDFLGGWRGLEVAPNICYTLSAWVWIPSSFAGSCVGVRIRCWEAKDCHDADLEKREVWQRVSTTATSPSAAVRCDLALCVAGSVGSTVASSCWQFERAAHPTGYVPTR